MIGVDTNLLVHAHRRDASLHSGARRTIRDLAESAQPWAICYHSLIEFYGVVTHSAVWRKASTATEAFNQIDAWRECPTLRILADTESSLDILEGLVTRGKVSGALVHDARIAACCLSHGVRELWTVDRDFSRFPELRARNPLA